MTGAGTAGLPKLPRLLPCPALPCHHNHRAHRVSNTHPQLPVLDYFISWPSPLIFKTSK